MSLPLKALRFAERAHAGQFRDYTGAPFVTHPIRVAARIAALPDSTEEMVAAAFLHDVVEDCGVPIDEIGKEFGLVVQQLVDELTNAPDQPGHNRRAREAYRFAKLATVSKEAKTIKLADRIDNLSELPKTARFWKTYQQESRQLLEVLRGANRDLEAVLEHMAYS
jgi:(p)ppGpp synthase/HD superfamily hydrolase